MRKRLPICHGTAAGFTAEISGRIVRVARATGYEVACGVAPMKIYLVLVAASAVLGAVMPHPPTSGGGR